MICTFYYKKITGSISSYIAIQLLLHGHSYGFGSSSWLYKLSNILKDIEGIGSIKALKDVAYLVVPIILFLPLGIIVFRTSWRVLAFRRASLWKPSMSDPILGDFARVMFHTLLKHSCELFIKPLISLIMTPHDMLKLVFD